MRRLGFLAAVMASSPALATQYFVDDVAGADANNGTSQSTAWKTVARVNSATLAPGDAVVFRRGGRWHEELTVPVGGVPGAPVTFGAYGMGPKPLLDATEPVTGWTLSSGSTWVASVPFETRQLYLDGVALPLAHHPNTGNFTADSAGDSSFLDDAQGPTGDLVGAGIRWRAEVWSVDESTITSVAGTRLNFEGGAPGAGWAVKAGTAYVVTDKAWMLDAPGEWHATASTVSVWLPDGSSPVGRDLRASTLRYGVRVAQKDFVVVQDLAIHGPWGSGVYISDGDEFVVSGLDITNTGTQRYVDYYELEGNGIRVSNSRSGVSGTLSGNTVLRTQHNGIATEGMPAVTITDNTLEQVGMVGWADNVWTLGAGIKAVYGADGTIIRHNTVRDTPWSGIVYNSANTLIEENLVQRSMSWLDDGGPLYSYGTETGGSVLRRNILLDTRDTHAFGIYMDEATEHVLAEDNTVRGVRYGAMNHFGRYNRLTGNTFYDVGDHAIVVQEDAGAPSVGYTVGNAYSGNIFFSKVGSNLVQWANWAGNWFNFGTATNNVFSNRDPSCVAGTFGSTIAGACTTLASWQAQQGVDQGSRFVAQQGSANPDDDSLLLINPSSTPRVVPYAEVAQAGRLYTDLDGNPVGWPVTVAPWRSVVLLWNGTTGCVENWTCGAWSWGACTAGQQQGTRTCTDSSACGTTLTRPETASSQACGTALPSPVAHWTLDAASLEDGSYTDVTGHGNDAAIVGAPHTVPGVLEDALAFDGVDDHLATPLTAHLPLWTVATWCRGDNAPGSAWDTGPVMKQENFLISWDHRSTEFRGAAGLSVGGTWYAASFGPLSAQRWYHLAATYDGTALRAYRDGVLVTTTPAAGQADPSTSAVTLGRHAVDASFFAGQVDDVRIYDGALAAAAIARLAQRCEPDGTGCATQVDAGVTPDAAFADAGPATADASVVPAADAGGTDGGHASPGGSASPAGCGGCGAAPGDSVALLVVGAWVLGRRGRRAAVTG